MTEQDRTLPSERVAEAVEGYVAKTIPVQIQLSAEQVILIEPEAEEILRSADKIALGPCYCRKEAQKCNAPVDVCLTVGSDVDEILEEYEGFRIVPLEQALEALRVSHEGGLIHFAYRKADQDVTQFCSCCSCCCWFLNRLKEFDYHEAIIESQFVAVQDREACVGCGACIDRCHFDAWKANGDGKPTLLTEKCFGCGVCASTCPANAIRLEPRNADS